MLGEAAVGQLVKGLGGGGEDEAVLRNQREKEG